MTPQQIKLQQKMDKAVRYYHGRGMSREGTAKVMGVSVRTVIRWAKRLGLTRGQR